MNQRLKLAFTQEDLEAADCLLMLSQSGGGYYFANPDLTSPSPSNNKFEYYQCNVCGKLFSSYQALGGHKTYHRVKSPIDTNTAATSTVVNHISGFIRDERLHECHICHKTFLSGQALGGHMGKHKQNHGGGSSSSVAGYFHDGYTTLIPRNFDLNLPSYF
ncbi:hypothetical protein RD792_001872 [Penstemon davidsonii]|uniref:C2H2-type domain-containing protein n=1 Tax=Penstemon davidsonii TaxID=160366 RepID=A0ABR0DPI5_9LAMI|nr:hypothetical protein RD792_001872 [Penstemon davidsonii]